MKKSILWLHCVISIVVLFVVFTASTVYGSNLEESVFHHDCNTSSNLATGDEQANLVLRTDQPYYYPSEFVLISGKLIVNGTGVQSDFCVDCYDPNGENLLGLCGETSPTGYFYRFLSLAADAPLGVYKVHAENHEFECNASTTFEVVTSNITPVIEGPLEGYQGAPLVFTGNVSGGKPPYVWKWDFGDGTNSTEQNPVHIYDESGTYSVNLTVIGAELNQGYTTAAARIDVSPPLLTIAGKQGVCGVSFSIQNRGATDATDVTWSVSVEGDRIILPLNGEKSGVFEQIDADNEASVFLPLLGYGPVTITIDTSCVGSTDTRSASGFVIGPFIRYYW